MRDREPVGDTSTIAQCIAWAAAQTCLFINSLALSNILKLDLIFVNFLFCVRSVIKFPLYNEEKNQYSNFKIQSEQNPIIFLTENFSIRIIELPKLVDGFSKIKAPLDYWIYFMKEAANLKGEEMKTLIKKNPKIKKAINELKFVYLNKKSREYYEMKFKADMDYSNDIT